MRNRISMMILGLAALVFVVGASGGCGTVSVTSYTYFYPDWTPDGRIVCSKLKSTSSGGGNFLGMPGGTTFDDHYYLTVMDANGSNEADVKEISRTAKVAASPLGNYYAYTDGNNITIITTAGATVNTIDCGAAVDSLDWGPDDNQIIYLLTATDEVYIVDRDGTDKELVNGSGSSMSWRYGNKIIMREWSSSLEYDVVAVNKNDFLSKTFYPIIGNEFNVSATNSNEVIYNAYDDGIRKFYLSSPEAESVFLMDQNDLWDIHLSPDGTKIVANGGSLSGAEIWLINVNEDNLRQVK